MYVLASEIKSYNAWIVPGAEREKKNVSIAIELHETHYESVNLSPNDRASKYVPYVSS